MEGRNLTAFGDRKTVLRHMTDYLQISGEEAESALSFLETTPIDFREGEYFLVERKSGKNLIASSGRYYINLSSLFLILLVQILDFTLTKGLAGTVLSIGGKPTPAFFQLSPYDGETCILKEIIRKDSRHDAHVLNEAKGLCYNCHLPCKYRSEARCTCSPENVQEILDDFVLRGILQKTAGGYGLC